MFNVIVMVAKLQTHDSNPDQFNQYFNSKKNHLYLLVNAPFACITHTFL